MDEIWKDVDGYEKIAKVSNLGRLMYYACSTTYQVFYKSCGKTITVTRSMPDRFYKNRTNSKYYEQAYFCKNGINTVIQLHVVVATAFIPNPENKPFVNHKNGMKNDNRVENLEWVTHSENLIHARDTGLLPEMTKDHRKLISEVNSKPMINILTNEVYSSGSIAAEKLGIKRGSLSFKLKTSLSHIKYYDSENKKPIL